VLAGRSARKTSVPPHHEGTQHIVTAGLVLRRWRDDDVEAMTRLNGDRHVMRFSPRTVSPLETRVRIAAASEALETRGYAPWAVEAPGIASCIGVVGPAP
jgi:RimJ/RimL family protein N-acetyltransferase